MPESRGEYVTLLKKAAERLLEVCDGAMKRDDVGFSRSDAPLGRVIVFTPAEEWTPELKQAAAAMLWHYHARQLSDMAESLEKAKVALVADSSASESGSDLMLFEDETSEDSPAEVIVLKRDAITPRLGFVGDILTVVSPGFGLAKDTKRAFGRLIRESGMAWSPDAGVHRLATAALAGDALPVGQVQSLKRLRSQVGVAEGQSERLDAYLARLEKMAVPTAKENYLRLEEASDERPTPEAWIAFPYADLERFKAILAGVAKRFGTERVGDGYQKGWWVKLTGPDAAAAVRAFAQESGLLCIGGARERLAELAAAPAPVAQAGSGAGRVVVAPTELCLDGERLVIPVPKYSPRFTDWIKAQANRMAKFEKTEATGPRWIIPGPKVAAFAVLLDPTASIYAECGLSPYTATIEVRRRLRTVTPAVGSAGKVQNSRDESLPQDMPIAVMTK